MLVAILIFLILDFIATVLVLSGFWDMYKRVRDTQTGVNQLRDQEASKHLQKIGKKG